MSSSCLNCADFAISLERIVREASANQEHEKIAKIVDQLCHEYAYAVHQPHARNGGLIGLAAASIALGSVGLSEGRED
jgi:vacuole morphology and inheritance protein 14